MCKREILYKASSLNKKFMKPPPTLTRSHRDKFIHQEVHLPRSSPTKITKQPHLTLNQFIQHTSPNIRGIATSRPQAAFHNKFHHQTSSITKTSSITRSVQEPGAAGAGNKPARVTHSINPSSIRIDSTTGFIIKRNPKKTAVGASV